MKFRRTTWLVGVLLLIGWGVRVYLGWASPSVYWPDEIFQTLEQAHRAVFGYGITPWEYRDGIRSWLFPGFLAGVMWATEWLGEGSLGYLFGVQAVLSALSLLPAAVAYRWARRQFDGPAVLAALVVPLCWMELIYFAPKAFYEVFTAHLAVGAIYLVRFADGSWWRPFAGGLLLGLCCAMRLQVAPVVVAVTLAIPLVTHYSHWVFSGWMVGVGTGLAVGGVVDAIVLGAPFQSLVSNYYVNLIEGKASSWGTSPWWQYIWWMSEVTPAGSVLLWLSIVAGLFKYPMLAWPAVAMFAAHSMIGHKEYRFIYPVIVFGTVAAGLWMSQLVEAIGEYVEGEASRWGGSAVEWVVVGVGSLVIVGVSVQAGLHFDLKSGGGEREVTNWRAHSATLKLFREVSTRKNVCGVGVHHVAWFNSGGFSHLHHDVPFVGFSRHKPLGPMLERRGKSVDMLVMTGELPAKLPAGFRREKCLGGEGGGRRACLLTRRGECTSPGSHRIGRKP